MFGYDILDRIAEATDEQTAYQIAVRFGGHVVFVPQRVSEKSKAELVQLIGVDKTRKIAKIIGHGTLEIPQAGIAGSSARIRQARKMIDQGATTREVTAATGYTRRHVFRLKANEQAPLPLFEELDRE